MFEEKDYDLGKRPLWAIFAAVIIFCALAIFITNCVAFGEGSRILPIYSVETPEKKIAVTFNCAWSADDVPEILEVLEKYDAKATFFVLGQWAKDNPSAVKMIAEAGHEIGSHSNTHPDMAVQSPAEIEKEMSRAAENIEKAGGGEPKLFRAPSGSYSNTLVETVSKLGYTTVQWDVDSRDWKDKSAGELVEEVTKNVGRGSIVLFHCGKKNTLEALPQILEILKNGGYEFIPVSELIYTENYTIDHTGRQFALS